MGITREEFIRRYPRLYHMAHVKSWPSIERNGLLSTSALLDLFQIEGEAREAIESRHRPKSVEITHPLYGRATIRDQIPMSERALLKCLVGTTPRAWYELLNRRVFLWTTEDRVNTLLAARAYRNHEHDVLTVDTRALVERHGEEITLSPINSGSTVYNPQPRGLDLFRSFDEFPFDVRMKYGKRAIAELSVDYSVPDLRDFVLRVERRTGAETQKVLFEKV
jgi:hypothetical protein